MTIEGAPWFTREGVVTLTRLPRPGWVLVSSQSPPVISAGRCVDVRPGRVASFDGDRVQFPLQVRGAGGRRRFDRFQLPELEEAVVALLRAGEFETVRFGDRMACRKVLSAATVDAIERRLLSAARRDRATLLTWTGGVPSKEDYRTYDVVVEGPAVHFD